ncbi:MAG: CCA tRNA nucleotidyltransferase, partial [Bacteroidota bacterium]
VQAALPDQELYLVGGAVRDLLLGRAAPDFDFAVPANGISLARRLANLMGADYMTLDGERDTGRVIVTGDDGRRTYLDFAGFRGANLEQDLRLRDFTVNAIAYDLKSDAFLDPLDGGADLRARQIRACSETSLSDDPVRVLRAVRLAALLGFRIEKTTREAMHRAAPLLEGVSPERARDELFKILEGPRPDAALRALEILDALPHLLPELTALKGVAQPQPHIHDVWDHTLAALQAMEDLLAALAVGYSAEATNDLYTGLLTLRIGRYREKFAEHFGAFLNANRSLRGLLFFITLYHDVAKPQTRTLEEGGRIRFLGHDSQGAEIAAGRAAALRLSNDEIERVRITTANHMRFHFFASRMEGEGRLPSRRAIYRFFRDSEAAGVDLVLLGLADLRATRGHALSQETWTAALDVARILLENYWEKPQETVAPPRLVDGHDLMNELGLEPGPRLGRLLEAIREGQATGKVSSRKEAIEYARSWLAGSQEDQAAR